MLHLNYPLHQQFSCLTRQEEVLRLLDNSSFIDTQFDWEDRLRSRGIELIGHALACPINAQNQENVQIDRHRAALVRNDLSRPIKVALEAGVLSPGKLRHGLLVHTSALDQLDPVLRLYEGCASRTIGRMENVTVVKFHTRKPKISYLYYPDFDTNPHPTLHENTKNLVALRL